MDNHSMCFHDSPVIHSPSYPGLEYFTAGFSSYRVEQHTTFLYATPASTTSIVTILEATQASHYRKLEENVYHRIGLVYNRLLATPQ
jgi:hypothetical protein